MSKKKITLRLILLTACLITLFVITTMMSSAAQRTETFYDYDDNEIKVVYEGEYEFTGEAIIPVCSVYANGRLLTEGVDYKVSDDGSVMPGEGYEFYISSCDNSDLYFGKWLSYDVTIDESKLSVADITDKTYTGSYICPEPKVYYGEKQLPSSLCSYDYDDNYDAGEAKVTVYIGYYRSDYSVKKSFNIVPASSSKVSASEIKAVTYDGYEQTPYPVLTYKGGTLYNYYDYTLKYSDNINAGTAKITIKFKGNFKGSKTLEFTINKLKASSVKCDKIDDQGYDGSKLTPSVWARIPDGKTLWQGEDFTVSYKNNVNIGTATATLKFTNPNIEGTKKLSFNIIAQTPQYFEGVARGNSVYLDWYDYSVYSYKLYKYDSAKKEYVVLKTLKDWYYTDKNVKQFSTYKYKIRAYVKIDGKTYYSAYKSLTVKTGLFAPASVKLTTKKDSVTIQWSKNSSADGYYVYRYDGRTGEEKKIATIKDKSTVKYVDKKVKNYEPYFYSVVSYCKKDGKTVKSLNSEEALSTSMDSITRGVKLESKTSYKVLDAQGSKTKQSGTIKLSSADIKTLKAFAKKHFKSGMTASQKVETTLLWIHSQVTYASSSSDWNKISGKSYVDAIFNYKTGQCAQYNGALAGMMSYLGFDVQLIKGYRQSRSTGKNSQHFWVECKIDGLTYVMECANKKDGDWWYVFEPYCNTFGYVKNGKVMTK